MKAVFAKVAFAVASLALFTNAAIANPEDCTGGTVTVVNGDLVCVMPTELPEPSSPLLFLGAAVVAGAVLKLRKK